MGRINFVLDDELENEFRKLVAIKYGARRGALGAALNEAVKMWIAKARTDLKELEVAKE